ncbi:MAG: VanW family protein [Actinomycetota bacterium]|nr:VanW family protein [Actinomycetota bacterium]
MRQHLVTALIAIPMLLVTTLAIGYVSEEAISADRVSRGVTAAGVDLSGLTEDEAATRVGAYEASLLATVAIVIVEGDELALNPSDAGFSIDERSVAKAAMTVRRPSGLLSNFARWLTTFTTRVEIEVPSTVDEEALRAILDRWTATVLDTPAHEGAVRVADGAAVPEYPRAGLRIDVDAALALMVKYLASENRAPLLLPLIPLEPMITNGVVDAAVERASLLIGSRVVLASATRPGAIVFTSADLATALRSNVTRTSPATLEVALDYDTLRKIASRSVDRFTVPPVNATFTFDEGTRELSIVPSIIGQKVDLEKIPEVVESAARGSHRGTIPMMDGDVAEFTTIMAQDMGPLGEVSSFTTAHRCCQARVTNIQLLADEIRGAIVMPGEEFSINEHAGERTVAEGYLRAGAIINGRVRCCDSAINIGGGTSQFATTFYNAVFFGCYEDVFHQPHSLYFSRYPFVREATLGWPAPDVRFRNDSQAVVYIHTEYTPTSITVTFFGNNGGRTCTSRRAGNTVTRVMEHADGSVTTQEWSWRYRRPRPAPNTTTTTTTVPPTTTTVTSG